MAGLPVVSLLVFLHFAIDLRNERVKGVGAARLDARVFRVGELSSNLPRGDFGQAPQRLDLGADVITTNTPRALASAIVTA